MIKIRHKLLCNAIVMLLCYFNYTRSRHFDEYIFLYLMYFHSLSHVIGQKGKHY